MREETLLTGRSENLHGRLWSDDRSTKGVVIIVHGLGDHGGRYRELAEQLVARGWSAFAFDLLGHGRSPGTRGRADSYDGMLADIARARATISERLPGAAQVLVGHSMGGNLSLNYLLRRGEFGEDDGTLAGLALCAPILMPPKPLPRPQIFAAWVTGHVLPWLRIDRPVDVDQLTGDESRAEAIRNDPMMHSSISIYLATQLLSQGRWALDHARSVDLPTLIMHGEADQLIDRSACRHMAVRIGAHATLVGWPELRHDLFHETARADVTSRLADWLDDLEPRP